MTTLKVTYDDGTEEILVSENVTPPPNTNVPSAVFPPDCWQVVEGDGQLPATQLVDYGDEDRQGLGETNMTFPAGMLDVDGRVKSPKQIVNLQGTKWLDWQLEVLEARNFEQKGTPEDGWEDTNDGSVPVFLPDGSINPDKARKQMTGGTGGSRYNVISIVSQGGTKYAVIDSLDVNTQPQKIDGVWHVNGKPMTWDTHPQYFTSRVNRRLVKEVNRTWISSRGSQAVSDGGIDSDGNPSGAKMKEWWANPSKRPMTQPYSLLRFYPLLPATIHLYKNSVIVDGNLVNQTGGITITIDAYRFYGSKVYVRDKASKYWYLAEEMLVRASAETGWYATAKDYRCYAVLEPNGNTPWMGDRGYGVPDPGIFRKDMTFNVTTSFWSELWKGFKSLFSNLFLR